MINNLKQQLKDEGLDIDFLCGVNWASILEEFEQKPLDPDKIIMRIIRELVPSIENDIKSRLEEVFPPLKCCGNCAACPDLPKELKIANCPDEEKENVTGYYLCDEWEGREKKE